MDLCDQSHILPLFLFLFPFQSALMSHKKENSFTNSRVSVDISFFQVQSHTAIRSRTVHDAIQKNTVAGSRSLWERCHLKCKE